MFEKILFTLILLATAAQSDAIKADVEPGTSKAFKLEYSGKISYILGTNHDLKVEDALPKEILRALDASEEVVFESPFFSKASPTSVSEAIAAAGKPNISPSRLSNKSKKAFQKIHPSAQFENAINPGIILFLAEREVHKRVGELRQRFLNALANSTPDLGHYGKFQVSLENLKARELILAGQSGDLLEMALGAEQADSPEAGLDGYVHQLAEMKGKKISVLIDTEPYSHFKSDSGREIAISSSLVTVDELNLALPYLAREIDPRGFADRFLNKVISDFLHRQMDRQYFYSENKKYIYLHNLLTKSLEIPGKSRIAKFRMARHKFWIDLMLSKMAERNVFFAVGLVHVVGDPNLTEPALLSLLRANGVKVTPLTTSCEDDLT
ncbi:MAG: TraB/GumN family protein [Bdellovibrionales bacterium]